MSYTYHNDKLQCFSLIDHILCSPKLVRTQDCVEILLHGDNLSDHLAISCTCSVSVLSSSSPKHTSLPSCTPKLNWDKGDITAYHTVLSQSLSNIALPTEALLCSGKKMWRSAVIIVVCNVITQKLLLVLILLLNSAFPQ